MPQGEPQDTLHRVVSADLQSYAVHVAFAAFGKDDSVTRFEKLEISPGLADEFRGIVRLTCEDLHDDLCTGILRISPYAATTKLSVHETEHLKASTHQSVSSQLELLKSVAKLEPFEEDVEFVSDLRFYVVVLLPVAGLPIYCFRNYTAKYQLKRSWFAAIKRQQGYYNEITEPGFLFDQNIDSICYGDDVFIINKDKFQRTFQFYEYVQRDAANALKKLVKRVPIRNLEDLQLACKQEVRIAAIVASLADAPHLDILSMTRIKREIGRLNLQVRVEVEDGIEQLVYEPAYKWEFLNLVCDNYAKSTITGIDYEVNSKRALRGRS